MAAIEEDGEDQGTAISAGRTTVRRAISGPLTPVTSGLSRSLADTPPRRSGHVTSPDGTDSQADSGRMPRSFHTTEWRRAQIALPVSVGGAVQFVAAEQDDAELVA